MKIRVLLVEDHKLVREGLRVQIENNEDIDVVGEAGNASAALKLVKELSPDVVVMDIGLPDFDGIKATREIIRQFPGTKIVALSMFTDKHNVMGMLQAGAGAYVTKDFGSDEVLKAIRLVAEGKKYMGQSVTTLVVDEALKAYDEPIESEALSPRENEILRMVAKGSSTKEIAYQLKLSVRTVDLHRKHLMKKLGFRNVTDLIRYAIRKGLISVDD